MVHRVFGDEMSQEDLLGFIESVSGDTHLAVEENLGDGFVRLKTAEAERRQAKHDIRCVEDIVIEMLRNARDAHARSIYLATSRDGDIKTLVFIDDGDGVPHEMQETIFEPRVTSKLETMVIDTWGVHGRGMALYSIRANTNTSRVVSSAPTLGSSFVVEVDLADLAEKTDQSSLPILEFDEAGAVRVASGPHNVARTVIEFAIDVSNDIDVYLGSPAEIAATLMQTGHRELTDTQMLFCDDVTELPVSLRVASASDALELVEICNGVGLEISERTAHRIFAGKILPRKPLLKMLLSKFRKGSNETKPVNIYRDNRGLSLSKEDLGEFSRSLEKAFSDLAQRYYIELSDEPKIRVSKDAITVKFPFEKEL